LEWKLKEVLMVLSPLLVLLMLPLLAVNHSRQSVLGLLQRWLWQKRQRLDQWRQQHLWRRTEGLQQPPPKRDLWELQLRIRERQA
jgi:hypothetical protein